MERLWGRTAAVSLVLVCTFIVAFRHRFLREAPAAQGTLHSVPGGDGVLPPPPLRLGESTDPSARTHFDLNELIEQIAREDDSERREQQFTMRQTLPVGPAATCNSRHVCVRQEILDMSDDDFRRFAQAVQALHNSMNGHSIDGYEQFTLYHRQVGIHGTPTFLAWHNRMLLLFERALQLFDDSVCLPYWNSGVDAADPAASEVFGPGRFSFDSGSMFFADWESDTPHTHRVRRDLRESVRLGTKLEYDALLDLEAHNICEFTSAVEMLHNLVHIFIGGSDGDMSFLALAPNDPLFFLHHCFIDYIWQRRLELAVEWCGRNDVSLSVRTLSEAPEVLFSPTERQRAVSCANPGRSALGRGRCRQSGESFLVTFENNRKVPMQLSFINPKGVHRGIVSMAPGRTIRRRLCIGQRWMITDPACDRCVTVIVPNRRRSYVNINDSFDRCDGEPQEETPSSTEVVTETPTPSPTPTEVVTETPTPMRIHPELLEELRGTGGATILSTLRPPCVSYMDTRRSAPGLASSRLLKLAMPWRSQADVSVELELEIIAKDVDEVPRCNETCPQERRRDLNEFLQLNHINPATAREGLQVLAEVDDVIELEITEIIEKKEARNKKRASFSHGKITL